MGLCKPTGQLARQRGPRALAALATSSYSGATRIEGAMLVRAGRYQDAIRAFQDASNYHSPNPWDWGFRAMAHYHLGQKNESRECLDHAARWIEQADHRKMPDVELTKPCWSNLSWYERSGSLRLFDEAQGADHGPTAGSVSSMTLIKRCAASARGRVGPPSDGAGRPASRRVHSHVSSARSRPVTIRDHETRLFSRQPRMTRCKHASTSDRRWSGDSERHGPEREGILKIFEKTMEILFGIAGDGNY